MKKFIITLHLIPKCSYRVISLDYVMKSWEYSKNIIAYFKSYPIISNHTLSFFSTVISFSSPLLVHFRSSYNNPEIKSDPYEIVEEMVALIKMIDRSHISIDLMSNLDYHRNQRHQIILEQYITPLIQSISKYVLIQDLRDVDIDLLSLQGLYNHQSRHLIPDVVNTVIYV